MRLDDELEFHIEEQTRLNIAAGMDPEEAARQARASLGSVSAIKDDVRDVHPLAFLDSVRQDLAYAVRTLSKSPAFTITAVLSLALGIGVNAAVFSAINEVLLKTLPVREPQNLVRLEAGFEDWSYPIFEDFNAAQKVFESVFASSVSEVRVRNGSRDMGTLRVSFASPEYFTGLSPDVVLGRTFQAAEQYQPVAVIHFDVWDREFQRDPAVLGKALQIGSRPFQIIGVTAPDFHGEQPNQRAAVWVPIENHSQVMSGSEINFRDRHFWFIQPMARLKPGVTLADADAHAKAVFPHIMELNDLALGRPHTPDPALKIKVTSGSAGMAELRSKYSKPLFLLQGAVILVLAIACFNLANLLYVRGWSRHRELGVRLAMGSHRGRLVRQLLMEGLVLALAGAVPAIVIASLTLRLLSPFLLGDQSISMDWRVLSIAVFVAILAGLASSVSPALRATSVDLSETLKSSTRSATPDQKRCHASRALVSLQIALSLTLAAASGMLLHNLQLIYTFDLGFQRENLLFAQVNSEGLGLKTPQAHYAFHARLLDAVRAIPGVQSISMSACGLITDCGWSGRFSIPGATLSPQVKPVTNLMVSTPSFAQNIGLTLLDGRFLNETDNAAGPAVLLVNKAFADKFLPGERPVGRTIELSQLTKKQATVVGLLQNSVYTSIQSKPTPMLFIPYDQMAGRGGLGSLEVRTKGDPVAAIQSIRQVLSDLDPMLIVKGPRTVNEQIAPRISQQRLLARLCTIFAILALALAAIGIYGVATFGVTQRTGEIGIRLAFGATKANIRQLILGETGWMALAGAIAGVPMAFAAHALLRSFLFRLDGFDYAGTLVATVVLAVVVFGAAWIPARRAASTDPMTALRYE